ncbi:MAG TPA: hypothetical protein VGO43_10340 [Pyrinomonadaceae bacterium]|jgi:hypothetical protein|nr:hypothetical protein [Pyrinomonadaceae bacterium]
MLFLIFLVFAVLISFVGWLINKARKGRMEGALGRNVADHEVTSLNSWMAVADAEEKTKQG